MNKLFFSFSFFDILIKNRGTSMKNIEIKNVLSREELYKIDAYFRAANYLSVA